MSRLAALPLLAALACGTGYHSGPLELWPPTRPVAVGGRVNVPVMFLASAGGVDCWDGKFLTCQPNTASWDMYARHIYGATSDDASVLEVFDWGQGAVRVLGIGPGRTTLRVTAEGNEGVEHPTREIEVVAPDTLTLTGSCVEDRPTGDVLWLPVGYTAILERRLYAGEQLLASNVFPPFDTGALTLVDDTETVNQREGWLRVTTPAAPITTQVASFPPWSVAQTVSTYSADVPDGLVLLPRVTGPYPQVIEPHPVTGPLLAESEVTIDVAIAVGGVPVCREMGIILKDLHIEPGGSCALRYWGSTYESVYNDTAVDPPTIEIKGLRDASGPCHLSATTRDGLLTGSLDLEFLP